MNHKAHRKSLSLLLCATLAGAALAADPVEGSGLEEGVVRMAANLNAMALACGHMSAQAVEAAKTQQRDAAIQDMQMAPAQFDRLYANYQAEFQQKWSRGSKSQQQQACNKLKPS